MSDEKIMIGDDLVEVKLKETSTKLDISLQELMDRYIRRGLFADDYYVPEILSRDELIELSKEDIEKDKKRGIFPKKHDFSGFVDLFNKSGD